MAAAVRDCSAYLVDSAWSGSAHELTQPYTTQSGDNLIRVDAIGHKQGLDGGAAATFNGDSLTQQYGNNNGNSIQLNAYDRLNPDIGTHDVVIGVDQALTDCRVVITTFTGLDTVTQAGDTGSSRNTWGTAYTDTLTGTADDVAFASIGHQQTTSTVNDAGQTAEHDNLTVNDANGTLVGYGAVGSKVFTGTSATLAFTAGTANREVVYWHVYEAGAAGADITGTGSVGLPALDAGGAGALDITGTGSVQIPALGAGGAGALDITGTGSVQIPALGAGGAGGEPTSDISGTGSVALPALNASGAGSILIEGTGSVGLPALGASGVGDLKISGTGQVTIPALGASGSEGDADVVDDDGIAITVGIHV